MRKVPQEMKDRIARWRDAAIADGWSHEATYQSEDISRAWKLHKNGYTVQGLTREPKQYSYGMSGDEYTMSAWCPKGIALALPQEYSMEAIEANRNLCGECKQVKPEIVRVGFANRVCVECEPAARKRIEYPGWCN